MMFVICSDELVSRLVDAISGAAHTGRPGDGVITVSEVSEVVRIGTGDRGEAAV